MRDLDALSREEVIGMLEDFAKNWLAHDGLWFQALEKRFGMEAAIECDREAWRYFTVVEAKRIMSRHGIAAGSGLAGLKEALAWRMYSRVNVQDVVEETPTSMVFRMRDCRVQSARKRKGLMDFPCKTVGIVEYAEFAKTIDERICTTCLACPPDAHPDEFYCAWKFEIR